MAETPTQKRKRSTKAELAQRISVVYSLLCEGKSRANVIEIAAELWDVSERSADDYLAAARKMLEDDCRISREAFMAEALAGYRQIRDSAFARGQLAVAKSCLDAQIELVGLKA